MTARGKTRRSGKDATSARRKTQKKASEPKLASPQELEALRARLQKKFH